MKKMEENKKITFENGKFTVYGMSIGEKDGMYCLSDLFDAMDRQGIERQQFGQYVRNRSFLRLVECFTGVAVGDASVIGKLCEKGLMLRSGRRDEARLYATLPIIWCILTDYNDTLTKDAADVVLLNK